MSEVCVRKSPKATYSMHYRLILAVAIAVLIVVVIAIAPFAHPDLLQSRGTVPSGAFIAVVVIAITLIAGAIEETKNK
jgi:membrane protease YdiL (CAAX protease family)